MAPAEANCGVWTADDFIHSRVQRRRFPPPTPHSEGVTKRLFLSICLCGLIAVFASATSALAASGVAPVPGPVVRGFDPPGQPWLAGHRGIDLLARPGTPVGAALAGQVTFAGLVAGRPVLVIDHGSTRTTYEPVQATVPVGTRVMPGQRVGTVVAGHSCEGGSCLHLGWREGENYLDPSKLFEHSPVRLLPQSAEQLATSRAELRQRRGDESPGNGVLRQPVPGRIGSGFGMRLHPIFKVWRMHSGIDIGARCGTPIRAAADGIVASRSYDSGSGNRLSINHPQISGGRLTSIYLHAQGYGVNVGQKVRQGQVVGWVGSTGWSTGCHLHLSVKSNGALVDPRHYL